jgi:hypothetical protein
MMYSRAADGEGAQLKDVSRAQRSTQWCAADPGPFQSVAVPDQRAPLRKSFGLNP